MAMFKDLKIGDVVKPEEKRYKWLVQFMIENEFIDWKEGYIRLFFSEKFEGIQLNENGLKTIVKESEKDFFLFKSLKIKEDV